MDLIVAYSKRADLRVDLEKAVEQLRLVLQGRSRGVRPSVRSVGRVGAPRSAEERLGAAEVRRLVADFHGGTPQRKLAERHGISLSSVKRLLRGHRQRGGLVDGDGVGRLRVI